MSASSPASCTEPAAGTFTELLLGYVNGPRRNSDRGVTLVHERRGTRMNFPVLAQQALRVAQGLRTQGIRAGDVVFVALPSRADYLAAFAGAVLLGALPCCLPAGVEGASARPSPHALAAAQALHPAVWIAQHPQQYGWAGDERTGAPVLALEDLKRSPLLPLELVHPAVPDDVHHLQLTSGSTGQPKAAALTHRNVLLNIELTAQAARENPAENSGAVWLPLFHDMGLISLLSALVHDVDIVLQPSEDFIRDPMGWLRTISAHRATTSAAPTFALAYCVRRYRADSLRGVDLSCMRTLIVGAERVDRHTLEAFARTFARHGFPRGALRPCYGLAEVVLACTVPDPLDAAEADPFEAIDAEGSTNAEAVLGMGRPLAGTRIEVRDEAGQPLPPGRSGHIHVSSPCLMKGYHGRPELTAEVIRDGWYATGDLGFLRNGQLYVQGRLKELIILRGRNYHPHEFEECVARHPHVDVGRVAAFGVPDRVMGSERLVLAIEPENYVGLDDMRASLQSLLRSQFGFGATEICFLPRGRIPRTTSRKVQRTACAEQFACGQFGAQAIRQAAHREPLHAVAETAPVA